MKRAFVVAAIAALLDSYAPDSTKRLSFLVRSKRDREKGIRDTPRLHVDSKFITDPFRQVA